MQSDTMIYIASACYRQANKRLHFDATLISIKKALRRNYYIRELSTTASVSHKKEFLVKRNQLREAMIHKTPVEPLKEGEVLFEIDKISLTANNISYAVTGDVIGYWKFFPAEGMWGKIPAWGFANVIESKCSGMPVGERFFGYFPIASHVTMVPGKISERGFVDTTIHRLELPALYNGYQRTTNDSAFMKNFEDERSIYLPLFATSWVISDYLQDNQYFNAAQVVITSVSSKTAFGLGLMMKALPNLPIKIIGLTSAHNADFVKQLNCCDSVLLYNQVSSLDPNKRTIFVDMAGNVPLKQQVHDHFGANLVENCLVGGTHWEADNANLDVYKVSQPGTRPPFFFAPRQFAKRDKEWGKGKALAKALASSIEVANSLKDKIKIDHIIEDDKIKEKYLALLENRQPANNALILSLR